MINQLKLLKQKRLLSKIEEVLLFCSILLLPTQLGKHFWPESAYVFSLPVDYLSPTLYVWDVIALGFIVTRIGKLKRVKPIYSLNPSFQIFILFLITQLLSTVINQTYAVGFVRLCEYLVVGLWSLMLSTYVFQDLLKRIQYPLLMSFVFEVLLSLLQVTYGHSIGFWIFGERTFSLTTPAIAKFNMYGYELLRPYGTFSHPNVLAAYILICSFIIWQLSSLSTTRKLGIGIVGSLIVVLSVSRTVFIAGLFFLLSIPKRFIVWIVIILVVLSPFLYVRFSSLFTYDLLSWVRREELFMTGLNLTSQNPFFGVGLNNFIPTIAYASPIAGMSRFLQPIHNIYLLTLSETGLIGFFGFLIFILYPLYLLRINMTVNASKTLLRLWIVILFLGLFDHYLLTLPQGQRLLFLVWGLSMSFSHTKS
jgi:O-antigen ligase